MDATRYFVESGLGSDIGGEHARPRHVSLPQKHDHPSIHTARDKAALGSQHLWFPPTYVCYRLQLDRCQARITQACTYNHVCAYRPILSET